MEELMGKMKNVRIAYGATKEDMSSILGLGVNGWRKYESGISKPSKSKELLIRSSFSPDTMRYIIQQMSKTQDRISKTRLRAININVSAIATSIDKRVTQYKRELFQGWIHDLTPQR